jgi:hypothetical protein
MLGANKFAPTANPAQIPVNYLPLLPSAPANRPNFL